MHWYDTVLRYAPADIKLALAMMPSLSQVAAGNGGVPAAAGSAGSQPDCSPDAAAAGALASASPARPFHGQLETSSSLAPGPARDSQPPGLRLAAGSEGPSQCGRLARDRDRGRCGGGLGMESIGQLRLQSGRSDSESVQPGRALVPPARVGHES